MTKGRAAILLAALLASGARAADPPSISNEAAVETEEDRAVLDIAKRLMEDAGARVALRDRILRSSLGAKVQKSDDAAISSQEADQWIREHPIDSARLAYGFAQDDAHGTKTFEASLTHRIQRLFQLNPKRYTGIFGRLNAAGQESKKIKLELNISEEEQRESLKRIFDGQSGTLEKAPSGPQSGGGGNVGPASGGPSTFAGAAVYDRLSTTNPTGYSPYVQAYQSRLNQRRVPGATKLVETGKLDAATLLHPFFELRFDIDRLHAGWRYQKAWTLAGMLGLGRELGPDKLKDPNVLAELEKKGAGKELSERFAKRLKTLEQAADATRAFRELAEQAKDRSKITPAFLKELGRRQKNAARWITAASLEEDVQRLEALSGFWGVELRDRIQACPAEESARAAYLSQGDKLNDRIKKALELETRSLADLGSNAYIELWDQLDKRVSEAKRLRAGLEDEVGILSTVPYRMLDAHPARAWWRILFDRWIVRLAPRSSWARRIVQREAAASRMLDVFMKVAAGNYAAARQSLQEVK